MIEPIRKPKAKRVIKTQSFPNGRLTKRNASKRDVLWGTWRGTHAKPSTPVVFSGIHYIPS